MVKTPGFHYRGHGVRPLVGELGSCMPLSSEEEEEEGEGERKEQKSRNRPKQRGGITRESGRQFP